MSEYFCVKIKKECQNCKYFMRLNYFSENGICQNKNNFNDPGYYECIEKFIYSYCDNWRGNENFK